MVIVLAFLFYPRIILKGSKDMEITYKENYKEPGSYVSYFGKKLTHVKVSGKVNTEKLGKYIVTYEYQKGVFHLKKKRIVHVVDNEAPTITLTSEKDVFVCPNQKYQEPGYSAQDNYDGDLTSKVKVEHDDKKGQVLYTVKDSSSNRKTVVRTYKYKDVEKPVLTLNGSSDENIYQGQKYVDDGFKAIDNCDGDLTSEVVVDGIVDTSIIGITTLKYQVTDKAGNKAIIERKVNVIKRPIGSTNGNGNGIIYLTFDDGPSSSTTPGILDILKEEGVKATFFVINHNSNLDYLIQRAYKEGHTIGLHSYSHQYQVIYGSRDAYIDDLRAIGNKVLSLTGVESKIIRFPGGTSNTISKKYSLGVMSLIVPYVLEQGYNYYDWNVASGDSGEAKTSSEVYQNVIKGLSHNKTNIVLMHDFANNKKTLNALRDIIHYGKNNGYSFDKIDMNTPIVRHKVNN